MTRNLVLYECMYREKIFFCMRNFYFVLKYFRSGIILNSSITPTRFVYLGIIWISFLFTFFCHWCRETRGYPVNIFLVQDGIERNGIYCGLWNGFFNEFLVLEENFLWKKKTKTHSLHVKHRNLTNWATLM